MGLEQTGRADPGQLRTSREENQGSKYMVVCKVQGAPSGQNGTFGICCTDTSFIHFFSGWSLKKTVECFIFLGYVSLSCMCFEITVKVPLPDLKNL